MLGLPCSAPCQAKSVGLDANRYMILMSRQARVYFSQLMLATVKGIVFPIKTSPKLALVDISFT